MFIQTPIFIDLCGISQNRHKGPVMIPIPLRFGISTREGDILNIGHIIRRNLCELVKEPGASQAVRDFSQWFVKSFINWRNQATFMGIHGEGDGVPIFAAPGVTMYQGVFGGVITCKSPLFDGSSITSDSSIELDFRV